VFCRTDQCSLTNSYVDDNSCLISEYLAFSILHDVFASRHLHITMSRNDYTVPTRCRHRGGIVDPLGCKACRAIHQPNQPIQSDTGSLDPKSPKTSQFSVIRCFIGIEPHASESYYHSYTVATSGVNRLASQICHNRLFRKKLQQNILPMISTEVSSLAAHNMRTLRRRSKFRISLKYHAPQRVPPDASQARLRYPMPSITVM
jgi:hypothetical protein